MELNTAVLKFFIGSGYLWFRLFGYGIHIKDTRKNPLLYSDRVNKRFYISKWQIKFLTRNEK